MSITMTVDHAQRMVNVRAEGPITHRDVLAHIAEEHAGDGLAYGELVDARGYHPALSSDEVRGIVAVLRKHAEEEPLGPTAIVVDSDVGFGMVRMLEMLVDDVCEIHAFRDMNEAERWLAAFQGARG